MSVHTLHYSNSQSAHESNVNLNYGGVESTKEVITVLCDIAIYSTCSSVRQGKMSIFKIMRVEMLTVDVCRLRALAFVSK